MYKVLNETYSAEGAGKLRRIRITVVCVAALICMAVLLLTGCGPDSKPGGKSDNNDTKEVSATPEPVTEDKEVTYVIKYTFELDGISESGMTTVTRPNERKTWTMSEVPELKRRGLVITSAEVTCTNLPDYKFTWERDDYQIMNVGSYKVLHNGQDVFHGNTTIGALHFADLNGDGIQEFVAVESERADAFVFVTQTSCELNPEKNISYAWCEETDEDIVIRKKSSEKRNSVERGRLVISDNALVYQPITNPTSVDSIKLIPMNGKPVECWFDYTKGDAVARQLIRVEEYESDDLPAVFVADGGNFYGYYPNPDAYWLKYNSDAGIVEILSRWSNQCEKILNAYVADLDGDDVRELCLTFQYSPTSYRSEETCLLIYSQNRRQVEDPGYDLRFVEENGKLVVKRTPVGGGQEETHKLWMDEDGYWRLSGLE